MSCLIQVLAFSFCVAVFCFLSLYRHQLRKQIGSLSATFVNGCAGKKDSVVGGQWEGGKQTNYRHWFTSRLPYGWLSLPVRSQVIQWIASIAMYSSYLCNPISASSKARAERGILIRSPVAQSPGQWVPTWFRVTPLPIYLFCQSVRSTVLRFIFST